MDEAKKTSPDARPRWKLGHTPSASDVALFEKKAMTGERIEDLARYQEAYLAKNFPELLTETGTRFALGHKDDPTFLPRLMEMTGSNLYVNRVNDLMEMPTKDRSWIGRYLRDGDNGTIILVGEDCASCKDQFNKKSDCELTHPDAVRLDQLIRIETANHETGHLLSSLLGQRKKFEGTGGKGSAWPEYAEENLAETYGALRMVQQLGPEALAYMPELRNENIRNLLGGDLTHYAVPSLEAVKEHVQKTPIEEIKAMSGRETFDLATKLSRPVSPEFHDKYIYPLSMVDGHSEKNRQQLLKALESERKTNPAAADLYEAIKTPIPEESEEANKLAKLNPLRSKGLKNYDNLDIDPKDNTAMVDFEKFNQSRLPLTCAPQISEQLKEMRDYTPKPE